MICGRQGLRKYKDKDKDKHKEKYIDKYRQTEQTDRTTDRPMMLYVFGKEMTTGV